LRSAQGIKVFFLEISFTYKMFTMIFARWIFELGISKQVGIVKKYNKKYCFMMAFLKEKAN
jgi:hypothetical protein